eukprot:3878960-Pleurochrysis_carterae.AAC.1
MTAALYQTSRSSRRLQLARSGATGSFAIKFVINDSSHCKLYYLYHDIDPATILGNNSGRQLYTTYLVSLAASPSFGSGELGFYKSKRDQHRADALYPYNGRAATHIGYE